MHISASVFVNDDGNRASGRTSSRGSRALIAPWDRELNTHNETGEDKRLPHLRSLTVGP